MGKCISKHPSVLTISLSEKDLAKANEIWNSFTAEGIESIEGIPRRQGDQSGNQLCEYSNVSRNNDVVKQQQNYSVLVNNTVLHENYAGKLFLFFYGSR